MTNKQDCIGSLIKAGISYEDATALRRISMTLHRWHELECGDGNNYGSWCITRGNKKRTKVNGAPVWNTTFEHDDDGKPFLEHHHYTHGKGTDSTSYTALPDRERGALARLDAIMKKYEGFAHYVQSDPRGCSLYILTPYHMGRYAGRPIDEIYNNGIAVYK